VRCVVLQPSYIPWRGYFHQIQRADVFVFYDDVQYDRLGWRNRNRIKTRQGPVWLTIPVHRRGALERGTPIREIEICDDQPWLRKHRLSLEMAYGGAPQFDRYRDLLDEFYGRRRPPRLADYTIDFTMALARELGIGDRTFLRSSELGVGGHKTERLLGILRELGADQYLSGPSAQDYLDEEQLRAAGIEVEYMRYDYPEYPQLYPPFLGEVSILDLLFMTGPAAPSFIWATS
jgi:hypothetical protein